jgi:sulfoxide reductase heme-binding subunit YedZ
MMPLRKELGILMGVLAFVHAGAFILPYPNFVVSASFWWQEGFITYLAMGMIALFLTLPLVATSNTWAMRKLGKHWKSLHRLAYGILIFTLLHVILIEWSKSGHVDFGGFIA